MRRQLERRSPAALAGADRANIKADLNSRKDTPLGFDNQSRIGLPPDFDPRQAPILALHWFGVTPAVRQEGRAA